MLCMSSTEQSVTERARAGDQDAYGELVELHAARLGRVCRRIIGNDADGDEAAQDALVRGWQRLPSFDGRSSFGTWIYRIAVRVALDRLRERQAQAERYDAVPEMTDHGAGPLRQLLSAELGDSSRRALSRLSADERTAFVLRYMEEESTDAVAAALGVSANTARQTLFRATGKLRQALAEWRQVR